MRWKPRGSANRLFVDSTARIPVPKIRRRSLPPALLRHLLDRIRSREISASQLGLFTDWLDTEPEVPNKKWFNRLWRRRTGEDVLNREARADRKGSLLTCRRCAVSAIHGSRLTIRRFPWSCSLVTFPAPRSMPLAPCCLALAFNHVPFS